MALTSKREGEMTNEEWHRARCGLPAKEDKRKRSLVEQVVSPHKKPQWRHPSDGGPVRVMAVVEGHVMARRPGCMVFVESVKDFTKIYIYVG